jgi:hypothetical protein
MRNTPVNMINAVDTVTQTGPPVFAGQFIAGSFTPVFGDSTAAGTVTVQISNEIPVGDPNKYVPSNGSFCVVTGASSTIASGAGPTIIIQALQAQYVRCLFTYSSGGSSTVLVNATFLGV